MEFTVELRYETGSQTVVSIDADSADEAVTNVRDQRRVLVGIHVTSPSRDAPAAYERQGDRSYGTAPPAYRRTPVHHRRSRRQG
jgi:hypothetical protein